MAWYILWVECSCLRIYHSDWNATSPPTQTSKIDLQYYFKFFVKAFLFVIFAIRNLKTKAIQNDQDDDIASSTWPSKMKGDFNIKTKPLCKKFEILYEMIVDVCVGDMLRSNDWCRT